MLGRAVQESGFRATCIDGTCEPSITYSYRIEVETVDGRRILFETEVIAIPPPAFVLHQNYPNPFNPSTTIRYSLAGRAYVRLEIFDIAGRKIACLVNEEQSAGPHSVAWNGRNAHGAEVSSGIYLYRLTAGKKTTQRKMVLLR